MSSAEEWTKDWTNIQDVFDEVSKLNERPLTKGEEELIRGQRQINRRFFNTINAILEVISPPQTGLSHSVDPLAEIKREFQKIPGERPPGCASEPEG